jgi:hypothetical protein
MAVQGNVPKASAITLNDGDCANPGDIAFALSGLVDNQSLTQRMTNRGRSDRRIWSAFEQHRYGKPEAVLRGDGSECRLDHRGGLRLGQVSRMPVTSRSQHSYRASQAQEISGRSQSARAKRAAQRF